MKRFQRRLCKNERQVKELMSDLGAQPTTHYHDLLLIFAVAFSRTGDPATREFGDAKVIRKFGDVPDSFEHAVKLHCVYNEIARMRGHIRAQEREIDMLNRAEMPTASGEPLLARMRAKVDDLCRERDVLVTACGPLPAAQEDQTFLPCRAGQKLGIKEVDDGIWLVSFLQYDLGYFDL